MRSVFDYCNLLV